MLRCPKTSYILFYFDCPNYLTCLWHLFAYLYFFQALCNLVNKSERYSEQLTQCIKAEWKLQTYPLNHTVRVSVMKAKKEYSYLCHLQNSLNLTCPLLVWWPKTKEKLEQTLLQKKRMRIKWLRRLPSNSATTRRSGQTNHPPATKIWLWFDSLKW